MRSAMEQIELNTHYSAVSTQRTAMYAEIMTSQMADLLGVAQSSLRVQNQQLHVQNAIYTLNQQQLAVSEEQLVQAMKVVQRLDLTNHRLTQIDASLADISGVLVQQNALIQKSLNRLATEAQELIQRGMIAHANEWYTDASRDFEAALQKDPYSAIAHYFLGKCLYHEGRNQDSNQAYQKCIFFARRTEPIFHCLALCDLAAHALKDKNTAEARHYLGEALKCQEQDKPVLISTLLECDLAEGVLHPDTCRVALDAFADENVDPEVLLEVLLLKSNVALENGVKNQITEEKKKWEEATRNALFQRLVSHFYRELDDFVYLAPRIRRGFMEAAGGKFISLGDPLADLLDWTSMIGEQLLARIELFPPEYPAILRFYRPLQGWNAMLVRLNQLISVLAPKSSLVNGQFVEKLNLG
jgi:tetratricopeptide (TPR) repeat protein